MAQNEKILAGVLEIFRHNPQKQFRVDQIEREPAGQIRSVVS